MNIYKLLTYDVAEHNRIRTIHLNKKWPAFGRSLLRRYHRMVRWNNLRRLWYYLFHPYYKQLEPLKPILFITISNNNDRVLLPMMNSIEHNSYSVIDQRDMNQYIPTILVLFYSLLYIWPLIKAYICADKLKKSLMAEWFDEFFDTIGYMVVIEKLLRHNQVEFLIMANDHVSFTRAAVRVAQELKIRTMYTQHCSVTPIFPPLEFSYSFLDGEESFFKYISQERPKGSVYLSGNSRFDVIKRYRLESDNHHQYTNKPRIGIASNLLDDEGILRQLCQELISQGFHDLTMRPHPSQIMDSPWYKEQGVKFSESQIENPFEFLSHVDILIAGETGIHLDAAMMGVRSICYNTTNADPLDWYSYIQNGLIPYAANIDELLVLISNNIERHKSQQEKARWYNAAYGMKQEGHVGEMLADFIRYEQVGDIVGFDKKYGFVERAINGCAVKVYSE